MKIGGQTHRRRVCQGLLDTKTSTEISRIHFTARHSKLALYCWTNLFCASLVFLCIFYWPDLEKNTRFIEHLVPSISLIPRFLTTRASPALSPLSLIHSCAPPLTAPCFNHCLSSFWACVCLLAFSPPLSSSSPPPQKGCCQTGPVKHSHNIFHKHFTDDS